LHPEKNRICRVYLCCNATESTYSCCKIYVNFKGMHYYFVALGFGGALPREFIKSIQWCSRHLRKSGLKGASVTVSQKSTQHSVCEACSGGVATGTAQCDKIVGGMRGHVAVNDFKSSDAEDLNHIHTSHTGVTAHKSRKSMAHRENA
jgi:hypothetical protein